MGFIAATHQTGLGQKTRDMEGFGFKYGERGAEPAIRDQWDGQAGQGTGETNRVMGWNNAMTLRPMGIRERENILGSNQIGITRVVWASGPMVDTEQGYVNIKLQKTMGEKPFVICP